MEKMIKHFLLFFLLVLNLYARNLAFEIDRLNKEIPYATKGQTVEILHKLENLYIQSVIAKDKNLIVKSLKGIIRSRKLLDLDTSSYEKEYRSLSKYHTTIKKSKHIQPKIDEFKPKPISRYVNSINVKDNTIVIKFDKRLKGSELIFYNNNDPKKSLYKTVYNIKAKLKGATKFLHTPLQSVSISQKDDILRVVLQNNSQIYSKAFIRGGNLFIKINNKKSSNYNTKTSHKQKPIDIIVKKTKDKKDKTLKEKVLPRKQTNETPLYASSKIIVIDPGHGGKDSGAVGYKNHLEKKAVLKVAKYLKSMLVNKGYKVFMTRDSDKFVSLKSRTHMATKLNADLFISIHANAAPKGKKLTLKGIETFFLSPARTDRAKRVAAKENAAPSSVDRKSKDAILDFLNKTKIIQSNKLAIDIQSSLLKATRAKFRSVKDGGVREAPFWVLVGAQMPAALIEIGYITNPMEGDRLYNPFYQKALAKGIYNGINNYFAKNR